MHRGDKKLTPVGRWTLYPKPYSNTNHIICNPKPRDTDRGPSADASGRQESDARWALNPTSETFQTLTIFSETLNPAIQIVVQVLMHRGDKKLTPVGRATAPFHALLHPFPIELALFDSAGQPVRGAFGQPTVSPFSSLFPLKS